MDNADLNMKRIMTILFGGLFGIFVGIIYMVNMIAY